MTIQTQLDNFRTAWESRVGENIDSLVRGDIEDLRHSGILDQAAKVGGQWPVTDHLINAHGAPFDLNAVVQAQNTIVTFYRGGWCPYCNLELRAYQELLEDIHREGAALVAISPEMPDHALSTAEKNDLRFTVLSDVCGALASALGIRFTLSDGVRPFYEKAGHALPERNGDGVWALPMPATFVLERGGRIAASFIEPDYRKRLEPRHALQSLQALSTRQR
jgi:peroxiredoxin